MSRSPTAPIMPSVSARPCMKPRGRVPQMRLSARSMTAKTHDPAHSVTTMALMSRPSRPPASDLIVARRNSPEPG